MAICLQIQTDKTELTYVDAKGYNCPNCGANSHKDNKCAYCGTESGITTFHKEKISDAEIEAIKKHFIKQYGNANMVGTLINL